MDRSQVSCQLQTIADDAVAIGPAVPGHGDEALLAADAIEPAQQELAESHHRFDVPNTHRLLAC
jgi:hypothetical protein